MSEPATDASRPTTEAANRSLDWVLRIIAKDEEPTVDAITEHFAPSFLQAIPVEQIQGFLEGVASELSSATHTEPDLEDERTLVTILSRGSERTVLRLAVLAEPPHQIGGLLIRPLPEDAAHWPTLRQEIPITTGPSLGSDMDAKVEQLADTARAPAFVAAVRKGGDLVHLQSRGQAIDGSDISADTIFRAGSVTKIVTALSICRLVDQGAFDLESPAADALRSVKLVPADPARPPTIRHLLAHVSGLPRHVAGLDGSVPLSEALDGVAETVEPPESTRLYSNLAYGLLGQIIEDVTGTTYADWTRNEVLEPLGMQSAVIDGTGAAAQVRPYNGASDFLFVTDNRQVADLGAGALCANAHDLLAMAERLFWGEQTVVSPEMLTDMTTVQFEQVEGARNGLGFQTAESDGVRMLWHNGGLDGFKSAWFVAPDEQIAAVILANRFPIPSEPVAAALVSATANA